jgi:hypothetical protein
VADDLPATFGHAGQAGESAVTEGVNQAGLVLLAEGKPVNVADTFQVPRPFRPQNQIHG